MNTFMVEKADMNGASSEELVTAKYMSVDMGCLQFFGPRPGSENTNDVLIKAYGIGGWVNAEIKYP